MNSVVIVGRVGQDSEIKYYESGKIKANFSVAVNRWDSKTNAEVTDWFNIDVWDKQAEFVYQYVKKGKLVTIDGRMVLNKWKDVSGNEREKYLIVANNVRLLGAKKDEA